MIKTKIRNISNFAKNIIAILVCAIVSIIVILPYIHNGALHCGVDMSFHLNRAYDLCENIRNGNFFPHISTYSFNQVGAAINMAYGALPLYPIAIAMLLINNPINAVYAAMIFFIFVSMIIAYAMGIKVWSSKKKALTFSFLYVLSAYNFSWLFGTFGLGQAIGYIFVPFIFYGVYSIFFLKNKEWYFLALGMTGVIYTHILSTLIYSSAILITLIIINFMADGFWKNFKYFIYACVTSLLSTLFYWNNIKKLYSADISTTSGGSIASAKLGLGDAIVGSLNGNNGTFGPLITILVIVGLILWNKQSKFAKITVAIGLLYFLGTTTIFDLVWNFLDHTPIVMIQWAGRLRMVSNFFFVVFATETVSVIINDKNEYVKSAAFISAVTFICLGLSYTFLNQSSGQTYVNYNPSTAKPAPFTNYQINSKDGFMYLVKGYNTGVGSLDYWPKKAVKDWNTEEKIRTHHAILGKDEFEVKYNSLPDGISYNINEIRKINHLDLPFLNYGNHYKVYVDGKETGYYETSRNTIGVSNISRGKHNVVIKYKQCNSEKATKVISILATLLLILLAIFKNITFIGKKEENRY